MYDRTPSTPKERAASRREAVELALAIISLFAIERAIHYIAHIVAPLLK